MDKKFGPLAVIAVAILGLIFILLFQPKVLKVGGNSQQTRDESYERVIKSGVIRMGSALEELPWGAIDPQTGEKIGGEVEIANLIAKEIGIKVEIVNRGFDLLIPELLSKKFDAIIAGISVTEERKTLINFSNPYFKTGQVIVVREDDSEIKEVGDLKEKIVGVLSGTTSHDFANTVNGVKEVRVYDNPGQYFEDTKNGIIDATIYDQPAAFWYVKNNKGLKIVGNILTREFYALGIRKEDEDLRNKIDEAIGKIIKTPEYKKIVSQWYGVSGE